MALTWNEIRTRAASFAHTYKSELKENAEAQSFWNDFLTVFGIDRRRVAKFERKVSGLSKGSGRGRIDLLWPGRFMAEHKSAGEDLDAAYQQALEYVAVLEEHERPQFIALSNFAHLRLYELATGDFSEFPLDDLPNQVEAFGFLIGKQLRRLHQADPVNVKAAEKMGKLHDLLEASGYVGHDLEVMLVRMLFLLFADDTGLFDETDVFYDLLADHTRKDGQDLGATLARLFQVLNQPRDKRQSTLPEHLAVFPYVNGELFAEPIQLADFDGKMHAMLLDACTVDWGQVSPAIFGSMFQAVMNKEERRRLGAHYTSEENILKALGPLFLDELKALREAARSNKGRLQACLDLLPRLRFLDPACGSGNFLILAYRELRRLELDALIEQQRGQQVLDIAQLLKVNVGQFYGIEYDEFPSQIARVAMWLMDHQMNIEASRQLGQNFVNLPLRQAAHILHGDALEHDWAAHLNLSTDAPALARVYIMGNPPFVGGKKMTATQRAQVVHAFQGTRDAGVLDYVSAWYLKAAQLMNRASKDHPLLMVGTALVSTNSVTQGEQVAPLWGDVLNTYGQRLTFAHQTFKWANEAKSNAAVHCVIVGYQPDSQAFTQAGGKPRLFTYATPTSAPVEQTVTALNPYLTDAATILVTKHQQPLRPGIPPIHFGNMPLDGGFLILQTAEERDALLKAEPGALKFIKPMLDAQDYLNGGQRWALWLTDATPAELAKLPEVRKRIEGVKQWRLKSVAPSTQKYATTPALFRDRRLPKRYLVVPGFSTERRDYIPISYLDNSTLVNNKLYMVPDADLYQFGVMSSRLHMDWMRLVGGRLKSDYSYTKDIVYNTFPWPDRAALTPKQVQAIENAAQAVLDARTRYPDSTLAQLYDPNLMPADLRKAHTQLDRAVENVYGIKANTTVAQRLSVLLTEYQALAPTLSLGTEVPKPKRGKKESKKA